MKKIRTSNNPMPHGTSPLSAAEWMSTLDELATRNELQTELARRRLVNALHTRAQSELEPHRMHRWFRPVIAVATAALILTAVALIHSALTPRTATAYDIIAGLIPAENELWPSGQMLRVAPSGAKLVFADGSAIWFEGNGALQSLNAANAHLHLQEGRLLARIEKRSADNRVLVETPHGRVTVMGTVFSVSVDGSRTVVRLFQGQLQIDTHEQTHRLGHGHRMEMGSGGSSTSPILRPDLLAALLITADTAHLAGPQIPELSMPMPPRDETDITAPEPPQAPPAQRTERTAPPNPTRNGSVTPDSSRDTDPAPDPPSLLMPPDEMQVEYKNRSGDAATGAAEERILEDALQQMRNGDHEEGRRILKQYMHDYPQGRYRKNIEDSLSF
jgi:ferric-dicitrate binding protein FerR (iron transport regulator)